MLGLLCLALPAGAHATADDCAASTKRWVAVRLLGPGWTAELAESVLTDIRAEVRHHGIDVCSGTPQRLPAPIVTLTIEASRPAAMHMSLDLTDPSSGKQPTRELQLDSMPADGHSLAVAVAADELLTSSWIKLASRPASEVAQPQPTQPAPVVQPGIAATLAGAPRDGARPRLYELALLLATERLGGGPWTSGLDLSVRRWLRPRWALELDAGARTELEQAAPHGRVRSRSWPLSLGLLASAVPSGGRARAGAATALSATPLLFHAEPSVGATATSQTALALHLRGELWADVGWRRFRLRACGGAGIPLRGVTADDTGVAVGGARGLALYARLGLVLEL